MFLTGNVQRGCGRRTKGAAYVCCGTDPDSGFDIEHFVVDPVIPWPGEFQRGVKIVPNKAGHNDLVIFVGKNFYPSAWSFIEEARQFGVSRKLSNNIPIDQLTPGKSKMIFVHSEAIPTFDYKDVSTVGPHRFCKKPSDSELHPGHHKDGKPCAFSLKSLSILQHNNIKVLDVVTDEFTIKMPSFEYTGYWPVIEKDIKTDFGIGVFLVLPITHFEAKEELNEQSKKRIEKAGYNYFILNY